MAGTLQPARIKEPAPPARLLQGLGDIETSLVPEMMRLTLRPEPLGVSPDGLGLLWHKVHRAEGFKLFLSSTDSRHRILELRVRGGDARWKDRWVKWSFAVRRVRELQGGDAVEAQDMLLENDTVLVLLVMPGETREATLEILPILDGETDSGAYLFDVRITDITDQAGPRPRQVIDAIVDFIHPESQFLRTLPGIYQEAMDDLRASSDDPDEPVFFERYLLGFEDAFEPIQNTLAALASLFGPYSTPPDFLLWISAWVCMPINENWSEMKRRRLISEAVELFRWRGTKKGLSRYLQIYTGVVPQIDDQPVEGMRLGADTKLGMTKLGDIPPHTFVVNLAVPDLESINEEIVHDIITFEKPAHTAYALRIVRQFPTS